MNSELLIRHTVEIPAYGVIGTPALTFKQWFPQPDEKITTQDENFEVNLWFDQNCLFDSHQDKDLSMHRNVLCERINVDIRVKNISTRLIDFLRTNINKYETEDTILKKEAENIGKEVYLICLKYINRFLTYCKFVKGQYWLEEINENIGRIPDFNVKSNAKATDNSSGDQTWFRWRPIHGIRMNIVLPDETAYIEKNDWKKISEHVKSDKKIDFPLELISKSRLLSSFGYRNNAVVDSVIALEVALNAFSQNPDKARLQKGYGENPKPNLDDLKNTISRMGFSPSVRILLPLILPPALITEETYLNVDKLITARQNIIHSGQRDVDKTKIYSMLKSAEQLTKTLMQLTIEI